MKYSREQGQTLIIEGTTLDSNLESLSFNFLPFPTTKEMLTKELEHAFDCEKATFTHFKKWGLDTPKGPIPFRVWLVAGKSFEEIEGQVTALASKIESVPPFAEISFFKRSAAMYAKLILDKIATTMEKAVDVP
jgi:hypothetical protein